jgi:4-hydroxy-3-polyprenylbenzoate decarboxylase
LLLAIGSERYTPYAPAKQPAEILTIANHILGTGQLSLAKFLFITADDSNILSTNNIEAYFEYILKRIDLKRDIHFYTNTTIDTLDYSGTSLNSGSKVVLAAYGEPIRALGESIPEPFNNLNAFDNAKLIMPGVIALQTKPFTNYGDAEKELESLNTQLLTLLSQLYDYPLIVICDNSDFVKENLNNFLWVTFTRCNPSHDIYGISSFTENKHWGCHGPLVFDARIKPHHAPPVEKDEATEKRIERLFEKGGSLYQGIK